MKDFISNNLTVILATLIVLNIIIVIFGLMGVGWQQLSRVPGELRDSSANLFSSRGRTSSSTGNVTRTVAGVISSPNIQLVCSDETYAAAVSKVRPAVVNVSAESITRMPQGGPANLQFDDPSQDLLEFQGIGSGIIIDSRGYILTCYHLVARASNIIVTPFGYEAKGYRARIVAKDEKVNLAILWISTSDELPTATLGDSAQMEVADVVLAIGSPFGLEQTVTHGIISDDRRDVLIGSQLYERMMQTDVPINRGSSGGPLINVNGEVIGINMAIYSPTRVYSGVSFAVPVNQAKPLLSKTVE